MAAFPGTLYLATFVLSLRDKYSQHLSTKSAPHQFPACGVFTGLSFWAKSVTTVLSRAVKIEDEDDDEDEDDRAGFSPHADTPIRRYVLLLGARMRTRGRRRSGRQFRWRRTDAR
jgi:hypothetical protein